MPSRRRHSCATAPAILLGEREVALCIVCAITEEQDRIGPLECHAICVPRREAERGDRDDLLARHREALAAGRQHRDPGAVPPDRVDDAGHRIQQVLAVVEHHQQPFRPQVLQHHLVEIPAWESLQPRLAASASHTAPGSAIGASSQSQPPSGKSGTASAATSTARRSFPTPPTPVSVTSGRPRTKPDSIETSASRPTNVVT